MKRKVFALLTAVVMLAAMMPSAVFAADSSLQNGFSEDEVRLSQAVTTDRSGKVVLKEIYDDRENLIRSTSFSQDTEDYNDITYRYDTKGNLTEERNTYSDKSVMLSEYTYDDADRMTGMKVTSTEGSVFLAEYNYDANGLLIRETTRDLQFNSTSATDYHYDANGRLTSVTQTENVNGETNSLTMVKSYTDFSDLSWEVETTVNYDDEPFSFKESWTYDKDGNLLSSVELQEGGLYLTENTYNVEGQLINSVVASLEDPKLPALTTNYFYNRDGLLEKEVDSDGYTTTYIYSLKQFGDVPYEQYYAPAVKWAVEKAITTGMSDASEFANADFAPDETCTRGQAVTFLWRAAGSPEPQSTDNPFTDVKSDDYFYKAVLWAVEKGVTNGTSDTTFSPAEKCTRGHIVTFLHRSQGNPEVKDSARPFTDVQNSRDFFYNAVYWAVGAGVTNGTSDTTFNPEKFCTRGQIVTFLYRAMLPV